MCVEEGSGVPNLQTEFNYLNSFKSYCIFSDFVVPTSRWSPHHLCHPHVIPTFSPSSPHGIHVVPTASWLWSPCCLCRLHSMLSRLGPRCPVIPMSSLHHLRHPHIIPTLSRRSPHHPQSPRYPHGGGGLESVKIQ